VKKQQVGNGGTPRGISAIKCKKEKRKHGKQKSVVKNAMDSYLGFSQRISSNSPCTPPTLYWGGPSARVIGKGRLGTRICGSCEGTRKPKTKSIVTVTTIVC